MKFCIDEELKHRSGIYAIRNENGKYIYIGKANDFITRYKTHCREFDDLSKNNIFNLVIEISDTLKWEFVVVEDMTGCSNDEMFAREKECIAKYGTICNYENQGKFTSLNEITSYKYKYDYLKKRYDTLDEKYNKLILDIEEEYDTVDDFNEFRRYMKDNNMKFVFVKSSHLPSEFLNLKPSHKLSLLKIGCHIDQNKGIKYNMRSKSCNNKNLNDILALSSVSFKRYRSVLLDSGLIIENDGLYYFNTDVVKKGRLHYKSGRYTRLFINVFKDMYTNLEAAKRKRLAYMTLLYPYINIKYNMLCTNPYEEDITKIEYLDTKDILKIMNEDGLDVNKSMYGKLYGVTDLKLPNGQNMIKRENMKGYKVNYTFNPNLIYGGTSLADFKEIESKFQL